MLNVIAETPPPAPQPSSVKLADAVPSDTHTTTSVPLSNAGTQISQQKEKELAREKVEQEILNYQTNWNLEKLIPLYRKLIKMNNSDTDEFQVAQRNYVVIGNKLEERESLKTYKTEVSGGKAGVKAGRIVGNQAAYRGQLLEAISAEMLKSYQERGAYYWLHRDVWDYKPAAPIMRVKVANDGTLKGCSVAVSSGDREADKYCVDTIKKTALPPNYDLADGECLSFEINIERSNAFKLSKR
jgi:hypothetical protein